MLKTPESLLFTSSAFRFQKQNLSHYTADVNSWSTHTFRLFSVMQIEVSDGLVYFKKPSSFRQKVCWLSDPTCKLGNVADFVLSVYMSCSSVAHLCWDVGAVWKLIKPEEYRKICRHGVCFDCQALRLWKIPVKTVTFLLSADVKLQKQKQALNIEKPVSSQEDDCRVWTRSQSTCLHCFSVWGLILRSYWSLWRLSRRSVVSWFHPAGVFERKVGRCWTHTWYLGWGLLSYFWCVSSAVEVGHTFPRIPSLRRCSCWSEVWIKRPVSFCSISHILFLSGDLTFASDSLSPTKLLEDETMKSLEEETVRWSII